MSPTKVATDEMADFAAEKSESKLCKVGAGGKETAAAAAAAAVVGWVAGNGGQSD